ncbi:hypothetical protein [Parageobacillus thermoglucosidasius]|jgi:hypothetical protein|uniref:Uncharacterized protein n=1 Tax=Parageobacillus thermoglucosidasius TaxID=1426 RepID=A0AB38R401_PARTM|nr:hypothetical protein [Parageobacillus thermoglucosidasius]RDE30479.1 hypothetical protein DV713_20100 [Parageobacillus thermoglucosidasius]UOE78318.1 hypothetical protein IMI45_19570 [Parageobacillus thermoglucosidasius]BDG34057.1 hypothetical protein PthBH41_37690 [Parageobacillus thermoglucosidasius]GCD84792.1 hypothetical protein PTHTG4_38580 [Parageobacillus thermoglucosidasius]GMO01546.1 hypothetical protein PthstB1num2_35860 [Parageobacillus thermoglucosidasius]
MKILFDVLFLIGGIGTLCKYIGIDFFQENSTWFFILFAGSGLVRLVFFTTKQETANEAKNHK